MVLHNNFFLHIAKKAKKARETYQSLSKKEKRKKLPYYHGNAKKPSCTQKIKVILK